MSTSVVRVYDDVVSCRNSLAISPRLSDVWFSRFVSVFASDTRKACIYYNNIINTDSYNNNNTNNKWQQYGIMRNGYNGIIVRSA